MIRTSDAWSTCHLSQRTSVLYCRLSDFSTQFNFYNFDQKILQKYTIGVTKNYLKIRIFFQKGFQPIMLSAAHGG